MSCGLCNLQDLGLDNILLPLLGLPRRLQLKFREGRLAIISFVSSDTVIT